MRVPVAWKYRSARSTTIRFVKPVGEIRVVLELLVARRAARHEEVGSLFKITQDSRWKRGVDGGKSVENSLRLRHKSIRFRLTRSCTQ